MFTHPTADDPQPSGNEFETAAFSGRRSTPEGSKALSGLVGHQPVASLLGFNIIVDQRGVALEFKLLRASARPAESGSAAGDTQGLLWEGARRLQGLAGRQQEHRPGLPLPGAFFFAGGRAQSFVNKEGSGVRKK